MIYTIAHLFRKRSLNRAEFSEYYETHHVRLAQRVLPEFSYYRRNHVIESTDDAQCPDSFSEFGYDQESKLLETMSILSDARGQKLMDDELQFLDKIRNQIYPVTPVFPVAPRSAAKLQPPLHKTIVLVRGAADVGSWLSAWQAIDPTLQNITACSEVGADDFQQLHWLMSWSTQLPMLASLQNQLLKRSVPILWCARVDECCGYPS